MVDSGSKRTLRVDPPRAKRAEQNDKDMDRLRRFRETKKRKENIQEQYEMLSQQQLHEEVHKEDGRDNSAVNNKSGSNLDEEDTPAPPIKRGAKVGSTATASAKATVKTNAQANAHKGAAANKLLPSSGNATVDEATLKSQLVANIAMRDRWADHFNFLLKELRMVWENGNMRSTLAPTVQAAESTVGGLTSDEELQDLGTVQADNPSNAKGTKTRKGPLYKGGTCLHIRSKSRASSVLTALSPLLSSANCNNTPVIVNSHRPAPFKKHIPTLSIMATTNRLQDAPPAQPRLAHSDLVTAIDWDVDSDDKKAELEQIEQDSTKKKGKSKSSDYQGLVWEILEATLDKVFAILLTEGFFIEPKQLDELIARTWHFCASRVVDDPTLNCYSISINKLRAIKYCITSWQGKLKDAIKPKIPGEYGLTRAPAQGKTKIEKLLNHGFHTQPGAKPRTGYYEHPFLQTACDATVFTKQKGKPPIGTKFSKIDKEEHNDTIVREMLEEYYKDHLDNLLTLAEVDPDAIDHIQTGMYQRGIKQAPIKPAMIAKSKAKANSRRLSIKDIVRLEPGPLMDCKDNREEQEEQEGSKNEEGSAAAGASTDTDPNVDANADINAKGEGKQESGKALDVIEVGPNNRWTAGGEENGRAGRKRKDRNGKGAERAPVIGKASSKAGEGEEVDKGEGKPASRGAKKTIATPRTPRIFRLRSTVRQPLSTEDAPEAESEEAQKDKEYGRKGQAKLGETEMEKIVAANGSPRGWEYQ
ncbi:hypothetical protein RhiXN_06377 [Rhizoctonia solani]|uniref:DUF6532 domain-containing protein n=1 Tax=Rhizoctonia solani TaxID=456999 RepID=A0A8H8SYI5_9AGAM|nr:uncharacterized protein RhiXN_06377 [Rhizoctonia solani]QRW21388.1 hypothetical protein RhiXN_06377 [Rhizoctonia solani]